MKVIKILNYIFPLVIGAVCSSMGTWLDIGISNTVQILLIFFMSILFSILLYYDSKNEIKTTSMFEYKSFEINFLLQKNIIIQLSAIIVGALCSSLGDWNPNQSGFKVKVGAIIFVAVVYIIFVIVSVIKDEKLSRQGKEMLRKIQEMNRIYEKVIQNIAETNRYVANSLRRARGCQNAQNLTINEVEKIAYLLCRNLHNIIAEYDTGEFYVLYSKRIEKKFIQTIAFASDNRSVPPVWINKIRKIDSDNQMDSKIMKNTSKSLIVCYDSKNIREMFHFNSREETQTYKGYLAIPVGTIMEIQGIFQVFFCTESTLFDDKEKLEIFAKNILPQYVSISTLINELYESLSDK